jgi:hypothetical protein
MGVPAVLRIFSDDHDGAFITEWASPERVIPGFARWIEECRTNNAIPTATNYRDFAAGDPEGDHFHDDYPHDATDPANIQYRYILRTCAMGNGWVADLTVWRAHERPDREPLLTVWHQVQFTSTNTGPIHEVALRGLQHIIRFVRSLDRPQHTGPALRAWTERANWHRTRTGAA